jgi:hypothetical protein
VAEAGARRCTARVPSIWHRNTTFRVHGSGLVISRMVNEFGIAKKVAAVIEEAGSGMTWPPA